MSEGFCAIWEFHVRADRQREFERRYGPEGDWARLFRGAPGFIGLELLQDRENGLRYVTLDRWTDAEAFRAFHASHAAEYAALDRECQGLTEREAPLGEFGGLSG
ncbi:MAG: antibiotic biosynthesis monooxygenase [Steroidobacteraceae bacterium]|nr:antibiotic biosynthesis monooxygenase [Steroidobacteraceae bacterium]